MSDLNQPTGLRFGSNVDEPPMTPISGNLRFGSEKDEFYEVIEVKKDPRDAGSWNSMQSNLLKKAIENQELNSKH